MKVGVHENFSINQIKDHLQLQAKLEGSAGLESGIVDFNRMASQIHLFNNLTSGQPCKFREDGTNLYSV